MRYVPAILGPDSWAALSARFGLSRREVEVAALSLDGLTVAGIADQLGLGRDTVRTYSKRIYDKVGVRDRYSFLLLVVHLAYPLNDAARSMPVS